MKVEAASQVVKHFLKFLYFSLFLKNSAKFITFPAQVFDYINFPKFLDHVFYRTPMSFSSIKICQTKLCIMGQNFL